MKTMLFCMMAAVATFGMACGDDDSDGSGGSGNSTSTGGSGATGGSTTGGSNAGGTGGSDGGMGGAGGGDTCQSCSAFLTDIIAGEEVDSDNLCTTGAMLWNDVQTCICTSSCGMAGGPCEDSCANQTQPSAECSMCGTMQISAGGECETEGAACSTDMTID